MIIHQITKNLYMQKNVPVLHDTHDQMCAAPHSYPLLLLIQSLINDLTFSLPEIHYQG